MNEGRSDTRLQTHVAKRDGHILPVAAIVTAIAESMLPVETFATMIKFVDWQSVLDRLIVPF